MRKSVLKNDPGYDLNAAEFVVLLDGLQVDRCLTADEEKGEVWVWTDAHNPVNGHAHFDRHCLRGNVEILRQGKGG